MSKKIRLLLAFILFAGISFAQTTLSGVVKDENGEVLPGASVIVKGMKNGTITDVNGKFSINISNPATAILKVTYIGMKEALLPLKGIKLSGIEIKLESNSKELEGLVVVGYGTMKKKDLTGAVSSVSEKDLKDIPVSSAAQAITGKLAGVNVTTTEGSPDADIMIRVRGGGSITQDNSPLYVVDGVVVSSISDVPPSDIASIDVLKDAASTAIYGARGANGVISITTKSAKEGKITLNFNSYVGIRKTANQIKVLSPYDFIYYQYEIDPQTSPTSSTTFNSYYGLYHDIDIYKSDPGTNWQSIVFGNTGVSQNYNLSLMGGSKDTKFNLSLNQTDETYTMIGSAYNRTNVNFKVTTKLNNSFDFAFNTRLAYTVVDGTSVSDGSGANTQLRNAVKFAPTKGLKGLDPTIQDNYDMTNDPNSAESSSLLYNPLYSINNSYKEQYKFTNLYNAIVNWNITNSLKFTSNLNYSFINNKTDQIWTNGTGTSRTNGNQPVFQRDTQDGYSMGVTNTLNYIFNLSGNQKFNILLGQEIYDSNTNLSTIAAKFFPATMTASEVLSAAGMGTAQPLYTYLGEPNRLSSFFGRINYSLKEKYLLTITAREDGASVFSPEKKWGFFPGIAAAWRISEEPFMRFSQDWLSNLKLRLSYGEVGNNRVGEYWRQNYSFTNTSTSSTYYLNEAVQSALAPSSVLRNDKLTWETTVTQNLGFDFGLFNNIISGTLEAYWNKTRNLIVAEPIPTASGYSTQYQNVGETSNKGVELSLNAYLIKQKDFTLSANMNISFNQNNVDKFSNGSSFYKLYGSGWNGSAEPTTDFIVKQGAPLGEMYGYVTDGMYTFDDFFWNTKTKTWQLYSGVPSDAGIISAGNYFGPGTLKLKDLNGDGKIDENDKTVIGHALPVHTGGFGINTTFHGFDAAIFFNWSYGNDIYNANKLDNTAMLLSRKYQNLSSEMSLANRFTTIDPTTGYNVFYGTNGDPAKLQQLNQNASIWMPLFTQTVLHGLLKMVHSFA